MKRLLTICFLTIVLSLACGTGSGNAAPSSDSPRSTSNSTAPASAASGAYVLIAWSELGMHCMDGKDYSVFSVLPPYNTIHAQLLKRGEPPTPITSGVTITYQATTDTKGSINSSSSTKTNFWSYVRTLFLNSVPPEVGLANYKTQTLAPAQLTFNATQGYWEAVGIPTVPYDDAGKFNPYPMAVLTARNSSGTVLASAKIVLAVSDEMTCKDCHASGTDPVAMPKGGWVNDPNPLKDPKLNILKKHDERWPIAQYLSQLQSKGWTYEASLYQTAVDGTPVLCAACHSDNALGLPGLPGISSLSLDAHRLHGPQLNPATGKTLDQATTDQGSCYLCHPGPVTQCKRGAMSTQLCADCHGNVSHVADPTRNPWLIEPACQMCHNTSQRFLTAFASNGKWRQTADLTFATNANVPVSGANLFRYSTGHSTVYCSGCHGSPHAEFPTLQPNDNVYSTSLQGHTGKITECGVCHTNVPTTQKGGPHGMHNIGQSWVNAHGDMAEGGGYQTCAYCHGSNYRGSFLSQTSMTRTFSTENGSKTLPAGHAVSCYDCHNGPNGG
jgi:hypothetical protein